MGAPVVWDVVEEHLDEADFLWGQWERGLAAPDYTREELAEREEERLLAQIDGLAAAGAEADAKLLVPALGADEPSRVSAAAFALLAGRRPAATEAVLAALRDGEEPQQAAVRRAVELTDRDDLNERLRSDLAEGSPAAQAAALSVLAFRRLDAGRGLASIGPGDDPRVVVAALRAACVGRDRALHRLVADALGSPDASVRDEALLAGLILGAPGAFAACRKLVAAGDPSSGPALLLAATGGDARDLQAVLAAAEVPALRGAALWAMGASGRIAAAEACLPLLRVPAAAKLAGEAFQAITGLPITKAMLAPEPAEGAAAMGAEGGPSGGPGGAADGAPSDAPDGAPAGDGAGEGLRPRAEDALPRLSPAAVEAWWAQHRSRFDRQRRHLFGLPFSPETVLAALAEAPTRRHAPLALELAVRTRGRLQLETRAFTARQRAELAALRSLSAADLARPYEAAS